MFIWQLTSSGLVISEEQKVKVACHCYTAAKPQKSRSVQMVGSTNMTLTQVANQDVFVPKPNQTWNRQVTDQTFTWVMQEGNDKHSFFVVQFAGFAVSVV